MTILFVHSVAATAATLSASASVRTGYRNAAGGMRHTAAYDSPAASIHQKARRTAKRPSGDGL